MEKNALCSGNIIKSLKGHDTDKIYMVIGIASSEFVLIADGKGRTVEKPKLKRSKHLKLLSAGAVNDGSTDLKNSDVINILRNFQGGFYA